MNLSTLTTTLFGVLNLVLATETLLPKDKISHTVSSEETDQNMEIPINERDIPLTPISREENPLCCKQMARDWLSVSTMCATAASQQIALLPQSACYITGNTCKPLACYGSAEVYFCNDKPYPQNPPCAELANFVAKIQGECNAVDDKHAHFVCGQQFDTGGFNVVVKRATDKNVKCQKPTFDCVGNSIWE
ncbi:hypothetical protein GLAREA_05267 [Glarea lozoyensis ATCC 20868]|uniref:Extracellular membrane protein CFEM domain-containing protein n=1 Tax=Glarea lozoyensis (strain ATCC 20868 / MF5171) TaxID=1116229 RepID=S3DFM6_GLAL2|nr:uncharacterized protein GLAREA_05267 [Glarea lozoyensis ATCC 20868]EPE35929.1 hypothetical protein GLAREA_05267 [Glarea lozoyensis ATCC 20868]